MKRLKIRLFRLLVCLQVIFIACTVANAGRIAAQTDGGAFLPPSTYNNGGTTASTSPAWIDVTKTQYAVDTTGTIDDTASLQDIIDTAPLPCVLYFPTGIYLISNTLIWQTGPVPIGPFEDTSSIAFQGQSQSGTIIRINSRSTAFDTSTPTPMIWTGDSGDGLSGGTWGGGNNGFDNDIMDMTLDAGTHLGAVGVDWLGNNDSAIRNVTVKGSGYAGIRLERPWTGPQLIESTTVNGFQYGVAADGGWSYVGATLVNDLLENQTTAGIYNIAMNINACDVSTLNDPVGVLQGGVSPYDNTLHVIGFTVLTNCKFTVNNESNPAFAIVNNGPVLASGSVMQNSPFTYYLGYISVNFCTQTGYADMIEDGSPVPRVAPWTWPGNAGAPPPNPTIVAGTSVAQYASSPGNQTLLTNDPHGVTTAPVTYSIAPDAAWPSNPVCINVASPSYGTIDLTGKYDDTANIIAAMNDAAARNAAVVYFPTGAYVLSSSITIPQCVQRVEGLHSTIVLAGTAFASSTAYTSAFIVPQATSSTSTLVIEELNEGTNIGGNGACGCLFVQDSSNQGTLILRDAKWWSEGISYKYEGGTPKGGHKRNLYVEDIQSHRWWFGNGTASSENVWAYQFNPEIADLRIVNESANVFICGLKTEDPYVPQNPWGQPENVMETTANGVTAVVGGMLYPVFSFVNASTPAFICKSGGKESLIFEDQLNNWTVPAYDNLVQEYTSPTAFEYLVTNQQYVNGYGWTIPGYEAANQNPVIPGFGADVTFYSNVAAP